MEKKRYIKIPKHFFKDLKFEIQISPFGKKLCCCGHENCIDLDCLMYSIQKGNLSTLTQDNK